MCAGLPALVHPQCSFRPGWSEVLAEEVGGEFKPEAPGIGAKSIEEGEEVLSAEDCVSQCKGQGRRDDTPAVFHHPRVWPPLHSSCLTRPVHHCLPWGYREHPHKETSPALPLLPPPWPVGRDKNAEGTYGKKKALPHLPGCPPGGVRSQEGPLKFSFVASPGLCPLLGELRRETSPGHGPLYGSLHSQASLVVLSRN